MSFLTGTPGDYLAVGVPLTRWDDPQRVLVQRGSLARDMAVYANAGGVTRTAMGIPDITPAGTVTASSDANGAWHNHATTAVANNVAGIITPFTLFQRSWLPELGFKIQTDAAAITTTRLLIGAFSATPDAVPTPTNIHGAYFRYDTSVSDTTWRCCTAAGAAPTVVDSGVPVVANSPYLLIVQQWATSVRFVVITPSTFKAVDILTTLPGVTTLCGGGARVTALAAAARNLKWARLSVCHF